MKTQKLSTLAKTIRSKNAGVDKVTFDIIFADRRHYETVRASGRIGRESMARLFGIEPERISDFVEFDPAPAIKFSILVCEQPSGSPGRTPISFGASAVYAPLLWTSRRFRYPGATKSSI